MIFSHKIMELILHNILIKIIIIIISIWLSYKIGLLFKKNSQALYQYKIKYFRLNLTICILFIIFFFLFIFVVRTRFLDKDINLLEIFYEYKVLISPLSNINIILFSLTILSLIFLFAAILKEIQTYLINQIIKCYLYLFFGTSKGTKIITSIQEISLSNLIVFPMTDFIKKIAEKTNTVKYIINNGQKPYKTLLKVCHVIVMQLPTIIICIYFFYELKFNSGILSSKFNSWFFMYLLYNIYKRITNYIIYSDHTINEMVFNMYYRDRSIKYANMPKSWEKAIYDYVDNGLSWTAEEAQQFNEAINIFEFFDGIFWKYTWKSSDGYIYSNLNNEAFIEENNSSVDLVKYPYHNT